MLKPGIKPPIDYGYNESGMGIYRGKWVLESVEKLFYENGIAIDYSIRGVYKKEKDKNIRRMEYSKGFKQEVFLLRSMGIFLYCNLLSWRIRRIFRLHFGLPVNGEWIDYLRTGRIY